MSWQDRYGKQVESPRIHRDFVSDVLKEWAGRCAKRRRKRLILLAWKEGDTIAEIAEDFRISIRQVERDLAAVRKAMKSQIGEGEPPKRLA